MHETSESLVHQRLSDLLNDYAKLFARDSLQTAEQMQLERTHPTYLTQAIANKLSQIVQDNTFLETPEMRALDELDHISINWFLTTVCNDLNGVAQLYESTSKKKVPFKEKAQFLEDHATSVIDNLRSSTNDASWGVSEQSRKVMESVMKFFIQSVVNHRRVQYNASEKKIFRGECVAIIEEFYISAFVPALIQSQPPRTITQRDMDRAQRETTIKWTVPDEILPQGWNTDTLQDYLETHRVNRHALPRFLDHDPGAGPKKG